MFELLFLKCNLVLFVCFTLNLNPLILCLCYWHKRGMIYIYSNQDSSLIIVFSTEPKDQDEEKLSPTSPPPDMKTKE
jgi:hypothetical protein